MTPALPSKTLLEAQAEWLAPARARLLRRVGIARRRRILDLGAGYGAVTGELVRRGGGFVGGVGCGLFVVGSGVAEREFRALVCESEVCEGE